MVKNISQKIKDDDSEDLFKIFTGENADQFENDIIKSRRLFINAKKGKNALFDSLKLKSKTLDMLILILQNNKNLIKSEDLLCIDNLNRIVQSAKLEKTFFDPILRKVKTIATYLVKNQINLKDIEKFKLLANFILEIMNTHFEQSFLQQIVDVLKNEEINFSIFIDLIFKKFFLGRNCLFKNNDLRFIIKNTIAIYGPNYFMDKLIKYMNTKKNGGARTTFQFNQLFNLLTFIIEISSSKILSLVNFKEKITEENLIKYTKKINQIVKLHLADDENNQKEEEKENTEKEQQVNMKKNKNRKNKIDKKSNMQMVLVCMISYLDRLFSFERKNHIINHEKPNDLIILNQKLLKLIDKISKSLDFKTVLNKIENIKKKNNNEINDISDEGEKKENEDHKEEAMDVDENN